MPITVRFPSVLRSLTQGDLDATVDADTVSEALDILETRYPGIKSRLVDQRGIRRFVNLYLGDEDVRFLAGLQTTLRDGDELSIVAAIAGGTAAGRGRYSRQIRLAEVGPRGQEALEAATAAVGTVGVEASVEREYLLRAGVGRLVAAATPLPEFKHGQFFVFDACRGVGEGAWRALRSLRAVLLEGDRIEPGAPRAPDEVSAPEIGKPPRP